MKPQPMESAPLFSGKDRELAFAPADPNPMVRAFGRGPNGARCRDCVHIQKIKYANVFYKCGLRLNSGGPATDHRVRWNACLKFERGAGQEFYGG